MTVPELTARVSTLEAENESLTQERDIARGELETLGVIANEARDNCAELTERAAVLDQHIAELRNELSLATEQLTHARAELSRTDARAAEQLAARGIAPTPQAGQSVTPAAFLTAEEIVEEIRSQSDPVKRTQLFRHHRKTIEKAKCDSIGQQH